MKRVCLYFWFLVLLWCKLLYCQQSIHNYGNLKLHSKGSLGFHSDLINDGIFDENRGLIGFYNKHYPLSISGAISPSFYDFEIGVEENLYLETGIQVQNSVQFIYGNIVTNRQQKNVALTFTRQALYEGLEDYSKVAGYVAVSAQKRFRFPVGNDVSAKPVTLTFTDEILFAKCSYYQENPNFPQSFAKGFNTDHRDPGLALVYPLEFWEIDTSGRIQLRLHWAENAHITSLTNHLENVVVTGWHIGDNMWKDLGNSAFEGDLNLGSVTSDIFNANDFEVFTFGFRDTRNKDEPGNFAITPNGDGINDYFTLEILKRSPNNTFKVYNRAGQLVFEKSNYTDEFQGRGNKNIFNGKEYLEEGVYFYLLELKDLNLKYQGYFYLVIE